MKITCLWCGVVIPQVWTIHRLFSFSTNIPTKRCEDCLNQLTFIDVKKSCPGCSRLQEDTALCHDCERWQRQYPHRELKHTAIFQYKDLVREWLHAFKYQGDYRLVNFLTKEWREAITPYIKTHQIVPIPISLESAKERGFNQIEALLLESEIPYQAILKHKPSAKKQAEKNRKERMESSQAFFLSRDVEIKPHSQILIVDDVYTTGRTLHHARDVLETAGVSKIDTLTLAR